MDTEETALRPDLPGAQYRDVLTWFHRYLAPASYFEIGTLDGGTLALAQCASIAVDPEFQVRGANIIGRKPSCALYQMPSDRFFAQHNPAQIFGRPIDLAFLDGMHRCEFLLRDFANTERHCRPNSVVILHDCIPLEPGIAVRLRGSVPITSHRVGWWTGDVWRTVVALKRYRPDLEILALDAPPTGLICVTNLAPGSTAILDNYAEMVKYMLSLELAEFGLQTYLDVIGLSSTAVVSTSENMTRYFWL